MRKILIIFVLLCLLSIVTALRFYSLERETYRLYIKSKETQQAENTQLRENLSRVEEDRFKLNRQLESIERQHKSLEKKEKEFQEQYSELFEEKASLESALNQIKEQFQKPDQEEKNLLLKISQLEVLISEKTRQIDQLSSRLQQREEVRELRAFTEDKVQSQKLSHELPPVVAIAKKEKQELTGYLRDINYEFNFVIINLGSNEGVKPGMIFRVYRDNKEIGEVKVVQIQENLSAADIKEARVSFKTGDLAVVE